MSLTDPHGGGMTQWCEMGRHGNCPHSVGGWLENGVWLPECYLTFPGGKVCPAAWPGQSYAMVVEPSHVWRCDCDCHQSGQMPLFGAVAS